MPAFPNKAAVKVGPLAPGASFAHALAFFPVLCLQIKADDGNMVPESNEANNKKVTKIVPECRRAGDLSFSTAKGVAPKGICYGWPWPGLPVRMPPKMETLRTPRGWR